MPRLQEVRDPYRGGIVAYAPVSTSEDLNDALAVAYKAKKFMAAMPGYERAALLCRAADILSARSLPGTRRRWRPTPSSVQES